MLPARTAILQVSFLYLQVLFGSKLICQANKDEKKNNVSCLAGNFIHLKQIFK